MGMLMGMGLLLILKGSAMMRGMMTFVVVAFLVVASFTMMATKTKIHFTIMTAFFVAALC